MGFIRIRCKRSRIVKVPHSWGVTVRGGLQYYNTVKCNVLLQLNFFYWNTARCKDRGHRNLQCRIVWWKYHLFRLSLLRIHCMIVVIYFLKNNWVKSNCCTSSSTFLLKKDQKKWLLCKCLCSVSLWLVRDRSWPFVPLQHKRFWFLFTGTILTHPL